MWSVAQSIYDSIKCRSTYQRHQVLLANCFPLTLEGLFFSSNEWNDLESYTVRSKKAPISKSQNYFLVYLSHKPLPKNLQDHFSKIFLKDCKSITDAYFAREKSGKDKTSSENLGFKSEWMLLCFGWGIRVAKLMMAFWLEIISWLQPKV